MPEDLEKSESEESENSELDGLTREELVQAMPRLAATAELLFGYAFGKLQEQSPKNDDPKIPALLGRSFWIKPTYAPSQIRESLRLGWQLFLSRDAQPEVVVQFFVNSIEGLTKCVFPGDFASREAKVDVVLDSHRRDSDPLHSKFATSALNLYRWFRNDAIHNFGTTFECDWFSALSLYFGIQHLLNLHAKIEERKRNSP